MSALSSPSRSRIHFQMSATTTGESSTGKKNTERKNPRAADLAIQHQRRDRARASTMQPTWKVTKVIVL